MTKFYEFYESNLLLLERLQGCRAPPAPLPGRSRGVKTGRAAPMPIAHSGSRWAPLLF